MPEGAPVTGRIVAARHFYAKPRPDVKGGRSGTSQQPALVLSVRLETLEIA